MRYISDKARMVYARSPAAKLFGRVLGDIVGAPLFYVSNLDRQAIEDFHPERVLFPANPCWIEYDYRFCVCFFQCKGPMWALFAQVNKSVALAAYGELENPDIGTTVKVMGIDERLFTEDVQKLVAAAVFAATFIASFHNVVSEIQVSGARKMRARAKKLPTFRHYELRMDHVTQRVMTAKNGGTHASPAWHIRRGHMRRLRDGRTVFVRSCEVGSKERGVVLKDYRL